MLVGPCAVSVPAGRLVSPGKWDHPENMVLTLSSSFHHLPSPYSIFFGIRLTLGQEGDRGRSGGSRKLEGPRGIHWEEWAQLLPLRREHGYQRPRQESPRCPAPQGGGGGAEPNGNALISWPLSPTWPIVSLSGDSKDFLSGVGVFGLPPDTLPVLRQGHLPA